MLNLRFKSPTSPKKLTALLMMLALTALLLPQVCGADTYYVDQNSIGGQCSDTNPGTITRPWRTLARAAQILKPGDTVLVRQGTYRETVVPRNSGTERAAITFRAHPNEKAVINGADPVTDWTVHKGAIYKAPLNWSLERGKNQVFVDGKMVILARHPNSTDVMKPNCFKIGAKSKLVGQRGATLVSDKLKEPAGHWDGALVWGIWSPRYHGMTAEVEHYTPGTMKLKLHIDSRGRIQQYGLFYISDSFKALDSPGEWWLDKAASTLYLWPPGGDSPSDHLVEAKRRQYAFKLDGKSYINIDGFDIFASTIANDRRSHHINVDNVRVKYVSHYSVFRFGNQGWGQQGLWDTGIQFHGDHNTISNSEVAYSAGNGVTLRGDNNTVHKCKIHHVNYMISEACAVDAGGHVAAPEGYETKRYTYNNRITHSTLCNTGRSIVNLMFAKKAKVLHNELYGARYGDMSWDLGAIYTTGTRSDGTEIACNYIHDCKAMGIYLDNRSYDYRVHHNVVDRTVRMRGYFTGIFSNHPNGGHSIYNNTVLSALAIRTPTKGCIVKNNICAGLRAGDTVTKSNNLDIGKIDPEEVFVDYKGKNFRLKKGSPAIDAGVDVGLKEDIEGNRIPQGRAPDIGAYELAP